MSGMRAAGVLVGILFWLVFLAVPEVAQARPPRFWQCVHAEQRALTPTLGFAKARRSAQAICHSRYDTDRSAYGAKVGLRLAPRPKHPVTPMPSSPSGR